MALGGDTATGKQDCELEAFHRLAGRLKAAFPRLPVMLLLDGLYPNGPVLRTCRDNHWQLMIVLQDASLPHPPVGRGVRLRPCGRRVG